MSICGRGKEAIPVSKRQKTLDKPAYLEYNYLQKKNDDINKDKKSRALYAETIKEVYDRCKKEGKMSKSGHGVSGNTHTQQQRNNYANQHNPNNNACKAARDNRSNQCNPNNAAYRQSREGSKK